MAMFHNFGNRSSNKNRAFTCTQFRRDLSPRNDSVTHLNGLKTFLLSLENKRFRDHVIS